MKLLIVLAFALVMIPAARAAPVISGLSINPSNPWLGSGIGVSLNCNDTAGNDITSARLRVSGEGIILPELQMSRFSNTVFIYNISGDMLTTRGSFVANAYCTNNLSESDNESIAFTISELSGQIASVDPAYTGDVMNISFSLSKDGVFVSPYPTTPYFSVSIDGVVVALKDSPYTLFSNNRWLLRIDAPSSPGSHALQVSASYQGKSVSYQQTVTIGSPLVFSVDSISNPLVTPGSNITARITANYRGSKVQLNSNNIMAGVGGNAAAFIYASDAGASTEVRFAMPQLQPGGYAMSITLVYMNYTQIISRDVSYAIAVSGSIEGDDGKGTGVDMGFISPSFAATFHMDGNGQFSGYIPPGTYTVMLSSAKAKLLLYGASLSSFDDAIKYSHASGVSAPGLSLSDVFSFGVALSFSSSYVELKYDDKSVTDESKLELFRCESWNAGAKICNSNWTRMSGYSLDIVRNTIGFNASGFSAYGIGSEREPAFIFHFDKQSYKYGETPKASGYVKDNGQFIAGIPVNMSIDGTGIFASNISDGNGLFEIEAPAPATEGAYTATLCADMHLFSTCGTAGFSVSKTRSLFVRAPDLIRAQWGQTRSFNVTVSNNGDMEEKSVMLSVYGIDYSYLQTPSQNLGDMQPGSSKDAAITITLPGGSGSKVYSMYVNASSGTATGQSLVAFTTTDAPADSNGNTTANDSSSGQIMGGLLLNVPQAGAEYLALALVSLGCIGGAFMLRKRFHRAKPDRKFVTDALRDIKQEIYSGAGRAGADKSTPYKKRNGGR